MKIKLTKSLPFVILFFITACGGGGSDSSSSNGKVNCLRVSSDNAGNSIYTNICDFRVEVAFFDSFTTEDTNSRFSVEANDRLIFGRGDDPQGGNISECRSPLRPQNTGNGGFNCA